MNRKMIMGLAAGFLALSALNAPAVEAKGKGGPHIHRHIKHHAWKWHKWHAPRYVVGYSDCGFYFWKWQKTGRHFWKSKYFACKAIY